MSWNDQACCVCVSFIGHPLHEDVSWNIRMGKERSRNCVILFMRMWVEIKQKNGLNNLLEVILFMRMWVEIAISTWYSSSPVCHPLHEDVSWNYNSAQWKVKRLRHPLREDVSWNFEESVKQNAQLTSSSSWGCELKWPARWQRLWRKSHPLREDVSWNEINGINVCIPIGHPPREDVSWNNFVGPVTKCQ